ncbi:MAG: hypothetical protein OEX00_05550 [Gammaproteobacteria bacterium]|nr:hypothetical protein [Gammaproteobacteria bacterium]MDH5692632.1 hypothetical protein [Gammaproteobacteria bacterium]
MARHKDLQQLRHQIAVTAARIMAEERLEDFYAAKKKAVHRLGGAADKALPTNEEIEHELKIHHSLFNKDRHNGHLLELRKTALDAMKFFESFNPRLVGPVLEGTAQINSTVILHLFAEQLEEVDRFLIDKKIPFELAKVGLRMRVGKDKEIFPAYRFMAGETQVELVVFPLKGTRQAPLSAVTSRHMERASIKQVEDLINSQ